MAKLCKCGCGYPVFSTGYAKYCQWKRTDKKKPRQLKRSAFKKVYTHIPNSKGIKKISDKELKRLAKYRLVRNKFMSNNPTCQVKGCYNPATDNHHKIGKIGELLWDVTYFMAVCRECHNSIEENPEWAYENGYSGKRLNK